MNSTPILATLALLLFISCAKEDGVAPPPAKKTTVVRSGTFFGECAGYCSTEMTIDSTSAVMLLSGWDWEKFPMRTEREELSVAEWNAIAHDADINVLTALDSIIGCPDCHDQGGEWIEIRSGELSKRVMFEHGAIIPQIAPLLEKVRAVRERFKY